MSSTCAQTGLISSQLRQSFPPRFDSLRAVPPWATKPSLGSSRSSLANVRTVITIIKSQSHNGCCALFFCAYLSTHLPIWQLIRIDAPLLAYVALQSSGCLTIWGMRSRKWFAVRAWRSRCCVVLPGYSCSLTTQRPLHHTPLASYHYHLHPLPSTLTRPPHPHLLTSHRCPPYVPRRGLYVMLEALLRTSDPQQQSHSRVDKALGL